MGSLIKLLLEELESESDKLIKKLHFAKTDQEAGKIKDELKKLTGWDDDDVDYLFKKFRKSIGFPDKYGTEIFDFSPSEYVLPPLFLYDGQYADWHRKNNPDKKITSPVQWNNAKYQKWLKSMTGNTDIENSADMAQNAEHEPGLIDYVKKLIRQNGGDESPLERIQWDLENIW